MLKRGVEKRERERRKKESKGVVIEGRMAVEGGKWWWQEVRVVVAEELRVVFYFLYRNTMSLFRSFYLFIL